MGRVQKGSQGPCKGRRQASNQLRQTDRISTAPGDKFELDEPVELLHLLVALFPVAVKADHLPGLLVDHQDVRSKVAIRLFVIIDREVDVGMEDAPLTVDVLAGRLLALDFLVSLLRGRWLGLHTGAGIGNVQVKVCSNPAVELLLGYVLHFGTTLGGVKAWRGEGQQDLVDGHKLGAGALLLLVIPKL